MHRFLHGFLAGALAASALTAQSPVNPVPLFATIPSLIDPQVATDPTIQRGMPVQLNTYLLYSGQVGDVLRFPAFDGESYDLRLEEREEITAEPGAFHWHFTVRGNPDAQGTLTVFGDAVAGYLNPGDGRLSTIALQPEARGMHCLRELEKKNDWCGCEQVSCPHAPADLHTGPRALGANADVPCSDSYSTITVLCLYEPQARNQAGGDNGARAVIANGLAQSSAVMNNNGLGITFVASAFYLVNYNYGGADMSAHLNRLTNSSDGIMDEIHALRTDPYADLVQLAVGDQGSHGNTIGIAWRPYTDGQFNPGSGFSVNEINAINSYTMVHEFGHNFGCHHDGNNAGGPVWRSFAYGWQQRIRDQFFDKRWLISVMGYSPSNCPFPASCTVYLGPAFTSPNVRVNTPIGTYTMGSAGANNAQVIRESRQFIADYSLRIRGLPDIRTQPQSVSSCPGPRSNSLIFRVDARNVCAYEWQKLVNGSWTATGQTSAEFRLSNVQSSNFGRYRCMVRNRVGTRYTSSVDLNQLSGPSIQTQPSDRTVPEGPQSDPNLMTVVASNAGSYQWLKQDQAGNFQPVGGQTGSSLRITNASLSDSGVYRCRIGGNCGSVDSATARLEVGRRGTTEIYGQGCGSLSGSVAMTFYERFGGSMDLQNTAFRFRPTPSGWEVSRCFGCFDGAYSNGLNSGDDQIFRDLPLGFFMTLPGGQFTNAIDVDSNGFVGLLPNTLPGSDYSEDVGEFLSQATRIAAFWDDLNPTANGDVYFDTFADRALVSWIGLPEYPNTGRNNFQLQLFRNGEIVLVYGSMTSVDGLVGYSVGNGVADPGSTDLTGIGGSPIELRSLTTNPAIGQPLVLSSTTTAGTINAVIDLGFLRQAIDLSIVGMEGCSLLTTQDDSLPATLANGNAEVSLTVPNDANLSGFTIHTQAVMLDPSANRLGVLTSNGVSLTIGTIQ